MSRLRVLFLCTGNSARSQMAEALLRQMSRDRVDVMSAGTHPQASVHPMARTVMEEKFGADTQRLVPKHLNQFVGQDFDFVITVCDRAAESCPAFPGDPERIHWSFEDPAAANEPAAQRRAFENVATGLAARIRLWMALPAVRQRIEATSSQVR